MTTAQSSCLFCGAELPERRAVRGSPRRFCCPEHRRAFETAARQYVEGLVCAGEIVPGELIAPRKARALPHRGNRPVRVVWGLPADARSAAFAGASIAAGSLPTNCEIL